MLYIKILKRILSFILFVIIFDGITETSFAKTPFSEDPIAIQEASKSVLMLICYDKYDNPIATGSGFIAFENNIIVTNYHVIEGDVSSIVANTDDETFFKINDILCYDRILDIAVLKTYANTKLHVLDLGDLDKLKKGSRVIAIGSPLGLLNTISEGIYNGIIQEENDYILFTAAISQGSSGGALFNDAGEVIGVTCGSYTKGQNLNLAIPIEQVIQLWNEYKAGIFTQEHQESNDSVLSAYPNEKELQKVEQILSCCSEALITKERFIELLNEEGLITENISKYYSDTVAIIIDGIEISPAKLTYCIANQFQSFVNNLNQYSDDFRLDLSKGIPGLIEQNCPILENGSWMDFFLQQAVESLQQSIALRRIAADEGITIPEEDIEEIQASFEEFDAIVQKYGYTDGNEFIQVNYGLGNSVDSVLEYLEEFTLAGLIYDECELKFNSPDMPTNNSWLADLIEGMEVTVLPYYKIVGHTLY